MLSLFIPKTTDLEEFVFPNEIEKYKEEVPHYYASKRVDLDDIHDQ
jgi:hypothetical protein